MRRRCGAVAVLTVALAATACAAPRKDAQPAAPSTAASTPGSPVATAPPPSSTTSAPPTEGAAVQAGARADIPDAVLLEQLRRRAERIAKRLPKAPPPASVDPGTNRGLGYQLMLEFGFPAAQWAYLDALWQRESGWNHLAENPSSGAYGIPQSLPASKMAVVGSDWRTNPETQIQWGLAYIASRYGTVQQAWEHSERVGWY